jgi:hypothetical protein
MPLSDLQGKEAVAKPKIMCLCYDKNLCLVGYLNVPRGHRLTLFLISAAPPINNLSPSDDQDESALIGNPPDPANQSPIDPNLPVPSPVNSDSEDQPVPPQQGPPSPDSPHNPFHSQSSHSEEQLNPKHGPNKKRKRAATSDSDTSPFQPRRRFLFDSEPSGDQDSAILVPPTSRLSFKQLHPHTEMPQSRQLASNVSHSGSFGSEPTGTLGKL